MAQMYCPHTSTCPFYKSWSEQTGSKRIDVIYLKDSNPRGKTFECQPQVELNRNKINFLKRGSKEGAKIEEIFSPAPSPFSCLHTFSLSLLIETRDKIDKIQNKKEI